MVLTSLLDLGPVWPWLCLAVLSLLAIPAVLSLEGGRILAQDSPDAGAARPADLPAPQT